MSADLLMKLMHGYKLSYLLFYAADKGIFNYLIEKVTIQHISKDINFIMVEKLEIMLNLFVGIGLLKKEQDHYFLHPEYVKLLNSESKESIIPLLKLEKYLMDQHNTYDKLVLSLEEEGADRFNKSGKEGLEDTYGQAMQNGGNFAAMQIGRIFRRLKKNTPKILDIGGGGGSYAISIVKCYPNAKVDVYERSEMEKICIENIKTHNLERSIFFHHVDITKSAILNKYDGILISNVLHLYNREMIDNMIKRVSKSLEKDGLLVLHDFFLAENHIEPSIPLLFTIDWLMIGASFNYSANDMEKIALSHGLNLIEVKNYKEIPTTILIFKKGA